MPKLLCLPLLLGLCILPLQAQQDMSPDASPSSPQLGLPQQLHQYFGVGGVILRDSYLSPLRYGGKVFSYVAESTRLGYQRLPKLSPTLASELQRPAKHGWRLHRLLSVDLGLSQNPAGNASIYSLQARYDWSYLRELYQGQWGTLSLGAGLSLLAGGRYSSRNGNNPGTLDLGLMLSPSLLYSKRLGSPRFPLLVKTYLRAGLLGTTISQEFGETYYELYYFSQPLRRFYLAHPGSAPEVQLLASLDLPLLHTFTLSLGYRWDYRAKHLNHLETQHSQHSLLIGLSTTRLPLVGRGAQPATVPSLPF